MVSDTYKFEELPIEVQRDLDKLLRLEGAGVDNWEGYDFAMEGYYEEWFPEDYE